MSTLWARMQAVARQSVAEMQSRLPRQPSEEQELPDKEAQQHSSGSSSETKDVAGRADRPAACSSTAEATADRGDGQSFSRCDEVSEQHTSSIQLRDDERQVLERIIRFPEETLAERGHALHMDRGQEWRARRLLARRGLVVVAGKVGKWEFLSPTDHGIAWGREQGIAWLRAKSGVLHEIIVRRLWKGLQKHRQVLRCERHGTLNNVQYDLLASLSAGSRMACQVTVTNTVAYELKNAARLAGCPQVTGVLLVASTPQKERALAAALAAQEQQLLLGGDELCEGLGGEGKGKNGDGQRGDGKGGDGQEGEEKDEDGEEGAGQEGEGRDAEEEEDAVREGKGKEAKGREAEGKEEGEQERGRWEGTVEGAMEGMQGGRERLEEGLDEEGLEEKGLETTPPHGCDVAFAGASRSPHHADVASDVWKKVQVVRAEEVVREGKQWHAVIARWVGKEGKEEEGGEVRAAGRQGRDRRWS